MLGKPAIFNGLQDRWVAASELLHSIYRTAEDREAAEVKIRDCRRSVKEFLGSEQLGEALRESRENVEYYERCGGDSQSTLKSEVDKIIYFCVSEFKNLVAYIFTSLDELEKCFFYLGQFVDGLQHPVESFGHLVASPVFDSTAPGFVRLTTETFVDVSVPRSIPRTIDENHRILDLPDVEAEAFLGRPTADWVQLLRIRFTECGIHESWFPWQRSLDIPLSELAVEFVAQVEKAITDAVQSGKPSEHNMPYLGVELVRTKWTRRNVPDKSVSLTPQQTKLLRHFLLRRQVVTSKEWFSENWGQFGRRSTISGKNSVAAAINLLSKALKPLRLKVSHLGEGWRLDELPL
ncbi:MAG: hypothetical protein ACKVP0_09105 [Pirellulaceae bacterium]